MYRQSEKNLLSSNISSRCAHNMVNFGPLSAEIVLEVWAPQLLSTASASWQRFCTACSSGRRPNFAVLNRGRHLYSAGRPSHWALAHISSLGCIRHFTAIAWEIVIPVCNTDGQLLHNCRVILLLLFMVALWNRADHYVFILFILSFFPRLISAVRDWMSTILPHMVWP